MELSDYDILSNPTCLPPFYFEIKTINENIDRTVERFYGVLG